MPQPLFDVFFRGALLPGADPGEARDRLAAAFGLGPTELERLFCGSPVCVKRSIDVDTAAQLRGRFRDAGALVDIRPAAPPPTPSAAATPVSASPGSAPEPSGDGGLTLAPPRTGSLADFARPVEAAPLPDISALELVPAGANVASSTESPPSAVDTSHLSVAPPNTGSLEDCRVDKPARAIGDISHLALSDD